MNQILRSIYRAFDQALPVWIHRRLEPEGTSIHTFVRQVTASLPHEARVLDAGAGVRPYADLFAQARYESTDIKDPTGRHDFVCDLHAIPRPDASDDAIVCNQVLEQVRDPECVLAEFFRLLVPGGRLFLTAPLCWGVHEAPHHYFNFTCYGLAHLLRRLGFEIKGLEARGGVFWFLGGLSRKLVPYLLEQHAGSRLRLTVLAPIGLLLAPFTSYLFPLVLYELDRLDQQRDFTLGYAATAIKPITSL